jgi:mitochondrial intermembrane space import and assembly protein 40
LRSSSLYTTSNIVYLADCTRGMQNCFREYPEIYGSELETDDEEEDAIADHDQPGLAEHSPSQEQAGTPTPELVSKSRPAPEKVTEQPAPHEDVVQQRERASAAIAQVKQEQGEPLSESDEVVPKAWHDGTQANMQVREKENK